jgi:pimeloyl-ACP methyl ester carboxylesterase
MPTVNASGADIHYQVLGEGPVIVMIHGLLLGNMATWYFGAAASLAKSHRVIVYDLRGHGMSGKAKEGYNLLTMVEDLRQLMEHEGVGETALIGHSYGSLIALHFARLYPERVRKMVMVEGPLPPSRGMQMDEFQALTQSEMMSALPEDLQAMIANSGRQGRKMLERLHFLTQETDLLEELRNERDFEDAELAALTMPVQLIYGRHSQLKDVADRLNDKIEQAELHWLDGGHYLPSERPLELGQTIGGFFR